MTALIVIDQGIEGYQNLIDELEPTFPDLLLLDPNTDGLSAIEVTLWNYQYFGNIRFDSIHIFSNGAAGSIVLGNTLLDSSNIGSYPNDMYLSWIGSYLTGSRDILLYGSSIAQGDTGQQFIDLLSDHTRAPIAASIDATGSPSSGGDWELEATSYGVPIQTLPIAPTSYSGLLGGTPTPPDSGPEVLPMLPPSHLAGIGYLFNYTIPEGTFDSLFPGGSPAGTVTYTATLADGSPLPGWLSFDSGSFSGTPTTADETGNPLTILITAFDGFNAVPPWPIELEVVTAAGSPGNDNITGSIGDDKILGLAGDDTIQGFAGNDVIYGDGDGNSGGWTYYENISGGDGDDVIYGSGAGYYSYLTGDAGNDIIYAGTNSNESNVQGGSGDDYLVGGSGRDRIYGDAGSDTLFGGDGNDELVDQAWNDAGTNFIYGGKGDDTIRYEGGWGGSATVAGGEGRDTYWLAPWPQGELIIVDFSAGSGGDVLQIGDVLSSLYSYGYDPAANPFASSSSYLRLVEETTPTGVDTLLQMVSDPSWYSGQTLVRLKNVASSALTQENFGPQVNPTGGETFGLTYTGTPADETVFGSIVADTIDGGGGYADQLYGYGGDDTIVINGSDPGNIWTWGNPSVSGGAGNDVLSAGYAIGYISIQGDEGNDTITGSAGQDYINGGAGSDLIHGGGGDDSIYDYGDTAGDVTRIFAEGGNDTVGYYSEGGGAAEIDGGDGNDTFYVYHYAYDSSTSASVTITGGNGVDLYRLNGYNTGTLELVSSDFAVGEGGDVLYINDLLAASNWQEGQGNPFAEGAFHYLRLASAAPSAADQFNVATVLQWDRDGSGTAYDWETVIELSNVQWKFGNHGLTLYNFAPKAAPDGSSTGVSLTGTPGTDTLYGSVVADVIDGAGGGYTDTLYGYGGNDELFADRYGASSLTYNYATLYGGTGGDTLWGNQFSASGWTYLFGDAGNDVLTSFGRSDYLYGGAGSDVIYGGAGDDQIYNSGGSQGDTDLLYGDAGNDRFYLQDASTVDAFGGTGDDTYYLTPGAGLVTVWDFSPYQPASGSTPASGDVLHIQNLLSSSINYPSGSNPFDTGHLSWVAGAGYIELRWDQDGAVGASIAKPVVRLTGTQAIDLLPGNYAPSIDGITVRSITVTDGYVRGADIYFDADGDGFADANEFSGGETDANGVFHFTNTQTDAIIAVGGTNVDTGLPNLLTLKAPNSASTVNPLTTLVQTYLETQPGATLQQATAAVASALGVPAGVDLLSYDPLAQQSGDTTALAVQKIAVQVAAVAVLSGNPDDAMAALTQAITNQPAGDPLDLTSTEDLATVFGTSETQETIDQIAEVNVALDGASDLAGVSQIQQSTFASAPNDAPVFTGSPILLDSLEGQRVTLFATDLLAGWSDPNGNVLTIVDLSASNGTLQNNNDGTWFFTPDEGFSGKIELSYQVSDGVLNSIATASLSIEGVNDAPVITMSGSDMTNEGSDYALTLSAVDPESLNDSLTYSIDWGDGSDTDSLSALELALLNGVVTHRYLDDADGVLNATARPITVTVTDAGGASGASQKTVLVNNVAPTIALEGAGTVAEDTSYTLTLGAVTDPGLDTVQGYVVDWGDGGNPEVFASAGEVSHTYAEPGDYEIIVGLGDEDGYHASAGSKSIRVTTAPTNTPPVISNESYSVHAGTQLSVAAPAGLLANDTDADGDPLHVLDFEAPTNGLLSVASDGSFTYTPNAGFTGAEVLSYTVSDGTDAIPGEFTLNVENLAPSVKGETYTVTAGATLSVSALDGLLANDTDADGDSLHVLDFEAPANGSLSLAADGSFLYKPNAGFAGSEVLSYTVSDGTAATTGEFTINVEQRTEIIRIGDAPTRVTNVSQFADAWSDPLLSGVTHTADASAATPTWSAVQFGVLNVGSLAGGDIFNGDLGVSGQRSATSTVKQEIDGTEGLRFNLAREATGVTVDLSRLYANDDGTPQCEAGRLRLLDADGNVVGETIFTADSATGSKTVSLASSGGFATVELSAGVYDGEAFSFGGYADAQGHFSSAGFIDSLGKQHGSDFMVNWIEFETPVQLVGIPAEASV